MYKLMFGDFRITDTMARLFDKEIRANFMYLKCPHNALSAIPVIPKQYKRDSIEALWCDIAHVIRTYSIGKFAIEIKTTKTYWIESLLKNYGLPVVNIPIIFRGKPQYSVLVPKKMMDELIKTDVLLDNPSAKKILHFLISQTESYELMFSFCGGQFDMLKACIEYDRSCLICAFADEINKCLTLLDDGGYQYECLEQ